MAENNGFERLDFRPSMRQAMVITGLSEETGGEISRVEIVIEADQGGPPAHILPQQREIYTVQEGQLTVTLDGRTHTVQAGESIEIPPRSVHRFSNRSDQTVRFTADHVPALRFEEYIRLVHHTVQGKKATLPVLMRIVRIESSYPETILPPPGPPRVVGKVLSGLGRIAGYPTGEELAASVR